MLLALALLGGGAGGQSAAPPAGPFAALPQVLPAGPVAAPPGVWVQSWQCIGAETAAGDRCGFGVSVGAGRLVVGAPYADGGCPPATPSCDNGAVYVFDAATGVQLLELRPDGPSQGFGYVTAVEGDLLLAGAFAEDALAGAAYLFDLQSGAQLVRLRPDDIVAPESFGNSVDLRGGLALVGAKWAENQTGAAYLFDAPTGLLLHKLVALDGVPGDWFGEWVALDGGLALVGAHRKDGGRGAAYLFDVATGAQLQRLQPGDLTPDDWFGRSVDLRLDAQGGLAAVGAPRQGAGAVYLFDLATGETLSKLVGGTAGDLFGIDVALGGGRVLVGAYRADGAAFLCSTATGEVLAEFRAPQPETGDWLGLQVAMDGGLLLLGAPGDDDVCGGPVCESGAGWAFVQSLLEPAPERGPPLRLATLPLGPLPLPVLLPGSD